MRPSVFNIANGLSHVLLMDTRQETHIRCRMTSPTSLLPHLSNLSIGCSKRPCRRSSRLRSQSETPADTIPNLAPIERDGSGRVVYVDLVNGMDTATDYMHALQARLKEIEPSNTDLQRMPLINRSRVLVEVEDTDALSIFRSWVLFLLNVGNAFRELVAPLGTRMLLLGGHFICPRVTEYEPRIIQQMPHTDVGAAGEVIGIGLNIEGETMRTLLDPYASLDADGTVQAGTGFRQANTPAFAFETGAVHAGPGKSYVPGPYPRFLTDRVFFLLCSAKLPPARVAKHRVDNALAGRTDLTFDVPARS